MTYHSFFDLSRGEKLYTNPPKNYIQIDLKKSGIKSTGTRVYAAN